MSELHFLTTPATRLIDTCKNATIGRYGTTDFEAFFLYIKMYIEKPELFTESAYKYISRNHRRQWDRAYKKAKYAINELSVIPDFTMDEFIDQLDEDGKYSPVMKCGNYVVCLEQIQGEDAEEALLELKMGWA